MPAGGKTSATFLAAAGEPPGTVGRAGEAELGRLADGCSARPRYRLLRGELIGRSSRSVAPIILCRQRNYKANSCPGTDKTGMDFRRILPEIRCQACLSPGSEPTPRGGFSPRFAPALIDRLRHQLDVLLARRFALGVLLDQ